MAAQHKTTRLIVAAAIASALVAVPLSGCSKDVQDPDTGTTVQTVMYNSERLVTVPDADDLAYDVNTRIVYYVFEGGYKGYMSPYLGEHGNPCWYTDGKIVEIPEQEEEQ